MKALACSRIRNNYEALETLYADEVLVDYTSLAGGEVELKSGRALMTQWASVLPGFERTRHQLSNLQVDLRGNSASATADVLADHYVNDLFWQVSGNYEYRFERILGEWKITSHRFNLESEQGTRDVFGPAVENAAANPASYILRQKTRQAVQDLFTAAESGDAAKFASLWAREAIIEMPFATDAGHQRVSGSDSIAGLFGHWSDGPADLVSNPVFYPMQDPEMVLVEFAGARSIVPVASKHEAKSIALFSTCNTAGSLLLREYFLAHEMK